MEDHETKPLFVGNLNEMPFPKLLSEVSSMGISGTLVIERGKVRKSLIFDHGKPARITSNLLQEVLGRYLVSIGKISQDQYTESIDAAFQNHRLHGDVLVERGLLNGAELGKYLREHAIEKLLNLFKWTEGEYRFLKKDFMSLGSDFLGLPVESIIFMGIRRYYSLERIAAVVEPYGGDYLYPGSKKAAPGVIEGLSEDERWLISLADGTKTVREIIEMSPLEFIDSYRLIYGAVITDILSVNAERGKDVTDRAAQGAEKDAASQILATYHTMTTKNYFEVLGVDEDTPAQDIKRAYVRLVKEYHPDSLGPGTLPLVVKTANQIFDLITKAYKVLTDQNERITYIRSLTEPSGGMDADKTHDIMNAELQFQKGRVFLRKRDYKGARESFGWAVKLVSEEGEYLAYLGWTLFLSADDKQGDDALTAVRYLKKAAVLNPSLEAAQLFLGVIYKEQKLKDIAALHFRKALEINPESLDARRELSLLGSRDPR
jgi:tetratricopeptide (TPR) repeat protein